MIGDLRLAFGFLTRLPVRAAEAPDGALARCMWLFPAVGAYVGGLSAAVLLLSRRILPAWPSAFLALAAGILLTGALHEDGLADCADGFGGGRDKEGKLAIMRDSRIGAYGALALMLSLSLRASALVSLHRPAAALVIAHCLSRSSLPAMMRLIPPAAGTGLAARAGRPGWGVTLAAVAIGAGAAVRFYGRAACFPLAAAALAGLAAGLAARRQIGGYTGDVLGAAEQTVEIAVLLSVAPLP